ncbi:MAG: type VII toxin-antitoxin system HepT family RNase toxin [Candidatus Jordarchaeum sp.]|uniref:type VII toxin-antitoxin system HepT family RNase toxin n=1 Tax=Candidatus Jordarchaeum sp. TaxID=2823881 RepID=UPI00404AFA68
MDNEGILQHLQELNLSLKDWERYQEISQEDLKKDRDKRNMVLHAMLVSIQSAIDLANHIIADRGLRKPLTYRESFEILSESEIITPDLGNNLSDLAGFRNMLVHSYLRLDLEAVYNILKKDIGFLREFKKIIRNSL